MKFKYSNPYHCDPPGAFYEILEHPTQKVTKAIEKVTFKEHRFSFFYWLKWYRELCRKKNYTGSPTLVSIDYHRDLAGPNEGEKKELEKAFNYDLSDLAMFCWARMNPMNDGHILSAAYLNIIEDIVILKQQRGFDRNKKLSYTDRFGKMHKIYEFEKLSEFETHLINDSKTQSVFLDIDLDYFISKVGNYQSGEGYKTMSKSKIEKIINPSSPYVKWIYERLEGFTIATEQKHCGGISNSIFILNAIQNSLFNRTNNWRT